MRVSKEKAAENRERLLKEASRLFRERGIDGAGMDELAAAAGLTHGSLYSQFGSKERLAAEAVDYAMDGSAAKYESVETIDDYVARYLSRSHRDGPGAGCAIAALGCEMPRQPGAVRDRFTDGVRRMTERIGRLMPFRSSRQREDQALAVAAMLVGGLVLSRGVDNKEMSDRILAACRAQLTARQLG
jgi:TetR/AcrR family transcriptional regulator, transcriptional repressor for nem operon